MTHIHPFATSYREARAQFIKATRRYDTRLISHRHPLSGPDGEELACDVVLIGPRTASRLLVCISGTHGVEGFAGSAAQIAWLDRGIEPPRDSAVLLIHGLNPWGFAHITRTTENNVDLNRNFIDFDAALPDNPLYASLHAALCVPAWTPEHIEASARSLQRAQQQYGAAAVLDALNRGQYSHPDGLIYGGRAPEWSNRILREILASHAQPDTCLVIDLHTGLGRYAEPVFLPFDAPGSEERRWVEATFGITASSSDPFEGSEPPAYAGLACEAAARELRAGRAGKLVIEIGTLPISQMLTAVQIDRLLRFAAPDPAQVPGLRQAVLQAFSPDDQRWRDAVVRHSALFFDQALQALTREPAARIP